MDYYHIKSRNSHGLCLNFRTLVFGLPRVGGPKLRSRDAVDDSDDAGSLPIKLSQASHI